MATKRGSDDAKRLFAGDIDWHLQMLVEDANDFGVEVPITLFVPGAVVAGVLTSGKVYFELFADRFSAGWPADGRGRLRESMASPGEAYPRLAPGEKSVRLHPAQFIHLRDARIVDVAGRGPAQGDGLLWRGRLATVAGYSFGQPSVVPAKERRVKPRVAGKRAEADARPRQASPKPPGKRRSTPR